MRFGERHQVLPDLVEGRDRELSAEGVAALVTGMVISAAAGWLVIRFLLAFLRKHRLDLFAYYRFVLAAVVAAYLWFIR